MCVFAFYAYFFGFHCSLLCLTSWLICIIFVGLFDRSVGWWAMCFFFCADFRRKSSTLTIYLFIYVLLSSIIKLNQLWHIMLDTVMVLTSTSTSPTERTHRILWAMTKAQTICPFNLDDKYLKCFQSIYVCLFMFASVLSVHFHTVCAVDAAQGQQLSGRRASFARYFITLTQHTARQRTHTYTYIHGRLFRSARLECLSSDFISHL